MAAATDDVSSVAERVAACDAVVANLGRSLSRQLKISSQEPKALSGLVKLLGLAKGEGSEEAADEEEEAEEPLSGLGQPTIDIEDNEPPMQSSTRATPKDIARMFGVSEADAVKLLGANPLEAAREINAARAKLGRGQALRVEVVGSGDARFGRWEPRDRYSLDQVPCMLVEGDKRTYHFKGANEHVWVAGSGKGDEGKRFCSLQILARMKNGDPRLMYNGQPWPEVCFRGLGQRISKEEKDGYNKHVYVRFDAKAWYNESKCLEWAQERMKDATVDAQRCGRESVLITDNLYGQTTDEFRRAIWDSAKSKVHLLPGGLTDLLQLIDAGFGYLIKFYMGEFHSAWMLELDGANLDQWTFGMEMWEKRVHITNMLHLAYAKACSTYDFEKVAGKLGMLITIDGSGDELINLQGLGSVTFDDADGGPPGAGSDTESSDSDDEEVEDVDDVELLESSDEEIDDTAAADANAAARIGTAVPFAGFEISETPLAHKNDVIGQKVMFKFDGTPLDALDFGWHVGTVQKAMTASEVAKNPGCSFWVKFSNKETGGVLPACCGQAAPNASAAFALGLETETRTVTGEPEEEGADRRWLLLRRLS